MVHFEPRWLHRQAATKAVKCITLCKANHAGSTCPACPTVARPIDPVHTQKCVNKFNTCQSSDQAHQEEYRSCKSLRYMFQFTHVTCWFFSKKNRTTHHITAPTKNVYLKMLFFLQLAPDCCKRFAISNPCDSSKWETAVPKFGSVYSQRLQLLDMGTLVVLNAYSFSTWERLFQFWATRSSSKWEPALPTFGAHQLFEMGTRGSKLWW